MQSSETAEAAVSPLITAYKPQVQNVDVNASYIDSSGNTKSGTIHHPGIAMRQVDLDNMRDHTRAGDEPWNTAFNAFAADSQSSKTPRVYYEDNYIFKHIQGPWAFTDPAGNFYSNPSDYVGTRANTDSETAFMQAIMWYITGDETYRANAMEYHQEVFCRSGLRYPFEFPFCYDELSSLGSGGNPALFRYAYGGV